MEWVIKLDWLLLLLRSTSEAAAVVVDSSKGMTMGPAPRGARAVKVREMPSPLKIFF